MYSFSQWLHWMITHGFNVLVEFLNNKNNKKKNLISVSFKL